MTYVVILIIWSFVGVVYFVNGLGKKNEKFIQKLNQEAKLFESIKTLEHPRYIQQYKSKEKQLYLDKYILTLNRAY